MLSNEIQAIQSNNAKFEKNRLIINDDMGMKEWKDLGYHLSNIQGNIQFWVGDWARFGTKKGYYTNSDVYDELEEITGLDRQTIKDYKWVADAFPSSLRKDDVSFNHHKECAKLDESDKVYFLNRAAHERLSYRDLRLQIIYETTSRVPIKNARYENGSPFPLRLGALHLKLQQEAFEMKTTIHLRALAIIREYFERKEKLIIEVK